MNLDPKLLPTFIIAGAPKCSTTAAHRYLRQHPDVFMPELKEPRFFTQLQQRVTSEITRPGPPRRLTWLKGIDWYQDLFRPGAGAKARGEASILYFSNPDSADLIREFLPDARLVFFLRDPVRRLYSHYWFEYRNGVDLPPFEEAIQAGSSAVAYYEYVSHYKQHLERFYSKFPASRILVLLAEDFNSDPRPALRQLFTFIGVDPKFEPSGLGGRDNAARLPKFHTLERFLNELVTARWSPWPKLSLMLPESVRARFSKLRRDFSRLNSRKVDYPPMRPETRAELVKRFAEDISYVEELWGRKLDSWRK